MLSAADTEPYTTLITVFDALQAFLEEHPDALTHIDMTRSTARSIQEPVQPLQGYWDTTLLDGRKMATTLLVMMLPLLSEK